MKSLIIAFILSSIFSSCTQKRDCIRPFTVSEVAFMDSIQQLGQKVEIYRFNYHFLDDEEDARCIYDWTTTYQIHISELDSSMMTNIDSLRILARTVFSKVYTTVIEDSILLYTNDFAISFTRKHYKPVQKIIDAPMSCDYRYSVNCKKQDLEDYLGINVIKFNNKVVRRKSSSKSDTLVFNHEIFSKCE